MLSPCQLSLEVRHAFNILLILHQNQNLRRDWRKCKSHIIPTDGSSSCATWLAISAAMWCILSEFLVCTIIIFELVDTNSKWHQLDLCYQPNNFQFPWFGCTILDLAQFGVFLAEVGSYCDDWKVVKFQ